MFSKPALLAMLLALPIAFARVDNGVYRISSFQSRASVRSYRPESPLFVSNSLELPGPYELFELGDGDDGGQIVLNLGLKAPVVALPEKEGTPVIATFKKVPPTVWQISTAGKDDEGRVLYTIQVANKDLLWNAEPPVIPRGEVVLRAADGSPSEKWYLQRLDQNFEDIDGTKTEAAAEKFGHILGEVLSQVGHELLGH